MAEIKWTNVDGSNMNGALGHVLTAGDSMYRRTRDFAKDVQDLTNTLRQGQIDTWEHNREQNTQDYLNQMLNTDSLEAQEALKAQGVGTAEHARGLYGNLIDMSKVNETASSWNSNTKTRAEMRDLTKDYTQAGQERIAQIQGLINSGRVDEANALIAQSEGIISGSTLNNLNKLSNDKLVSDRNHLVALMNATANTNSVNASIEQQRRADELSAVNALSSSWKDLNEAQNALNQSNNDYQGKSVNSQTSTIQLLDRDPLASQSENATAIGELRDEFNQFFADPRKITLQDVASISGTINRYADNKIIGSDTQNALLQIVSEVGENANKYTEDQTNLNNAREAAAFKFEMLKKVNPEVYSKIFGSGSSSGNGNNENINKQGTISSTTNGINGSMTYSVNQTGSTNNNNNNNNESKQVQQELQQQLIEPEQNNNQNKTLAQKVEEAEQVVKQNRNNNSNNVTSTESEVDNTVIGSNNTNEEELYNGNDITEQERTQTLQELNNTGSTEEFTPKQKEYMAKFQNAPVNQQLEVQEMFRLQNQLAGMGINNPNRAIIQNQYDTLKGSVDNNLKHIENTMNYDITSEKGLQHITDELNQVSKLDMAGIVNGQPQTPDQGLTHEYITNQVMDSIFANDGQYNVVFTTDGNISIKNLDVLSGKLTRKELELKNKGASNTELFKVQEGKRILGVLRTLANNGGSGRKAGESMRDYFRREVSNVKRVTTEQIMDTYATQQQSIMNQASNGDSGLTSTISDIASATLSDSEREAIAEGEATAKGQKLEKFDVKKSKTVGDVELSYNPETGEISGSIMYPSKYSSAKFQSQFGDKGANLNSMTVQQMSRSIDWLKLGTHANGKDKSWYRKDPDNWFGNTFKVAEDHITELLNSNDPALVAEGNMKKAVYAVTLGKYAHILDNATTDETYEKGVEALDRELNALVRDTTSFNPSSINQLRDTQSNYSKALRNAISDTNALTTMTKASQTGNSFAKQAKMESSNYINNTKTQDGVSAIYQSAKFNPVRESISNAMNQANEMRKVMDELDSYKSVPKTYNGALIRLGSAVRNNQSKNSERIKELNNQIDRFDVSKINAILKNMKKLKERTGLTDLDSNIAFLDDFVKEINKRQKKN